MRRTQIDEVLRVLDDVFEQLGVQGGFGPACSLANEIRKLNPENDIAAKIGMTFAEYVVQQHAGASLNQILSTHGTFPTREQLEDALVTAPNLTSDDLALLDSLKNLPRSLRKSLTDIAREVRPKGGHPVTVPRSEYTNICDEITRMVRSGMKLGQAKQRVAALRGCSASTINAIWRMRGKQQLET